MSAAQPLMSGRGLTRRFRQRSTRLLEPARWTTALEDADIDVFEGTAVGIIGESGSGKSTLVRLLLGLDAPTAGAVTVAGRPVDARASARSLHWLRRETGIVFQDPYASLDPRMSIGRIVGEPLWALGIERPRLILLSLGQLLGLALLTLALAIPLGILLAWCLVAVVNVQAFGWRLPLQVFPGQLLALSAIALLATLLAAAWPLLRLQRSQPLDLLRELGNER